MEGKKRSLVVNRQEQGSKASDVSSTWILKSLRMGLLWGRGSNYSPKSIPSGNQEARTGNPTVTVRTRSGIAAWLGLQRSGNLSRKRDSDVEKQKQGMKKPQSPTTCPEGPKCKKNLPSEQQVGPLP